MQLACRLLVGLLLVAANVGASAHAQIPVCSGKNILDELREEDRTAHERIVAASSSIENANAIFWRIEKDGAPPSHLFGTMHLTDERINTLSPGVTRALAGARRVVLELEDLSPDSFLKILAGNRRMVDMMLFTDGRRLGQFVDQDEFHKLMEILSRSGVPPSIANLFRPWVATLLLSMSICEQRRIAAGLLPLDARLAKDAESRDIKAEGLETLESQFRALANVPERDQIEMLKSGVRFADRIDDMMETMVQLYLQRRLGAIWPLQVILAEKAGVAASAFETTEQSVIVARNLGMRDKALEMLAEGSAFIAVGALHLPGKQGLVALFREAGYTLTALE